MNRNTQYNYTRYILFDTFGFNVVFDPRDYGIGFVFGTGTDTRPPWGKMVPIGFISIQIGPLVFTRFWKTV